MYLDLGSEEVLISPTGSVRKSGYKDLAIRSIHRGVRRIGCVPSHHSTLPLTYGIDYDGPSQSRMVKNTNASLRFPRSGTGVMVMFARDRFQADSEMGGDV